MGVSWLWTRGERLRWPGSDIYPRAGGAESGADRAHVGSHMRLKPCQVGGARTLRHPQGRAESSRGARTRKPGKAPSTGRSPLYLLRKGDGGT